MHIERVLTKCERDFTTSILKLASSNVHWSTSRPIHVERWFDVHQWLSGGDIMWFKEHTVDYSWQAQGKKIVRPVLCCHYGERKVCKIHWMAVRETVRCTKCYSPEWQSWAGTRHDSSFLWISFSFREEELVDQVEKAIPGSILKRVAYGAWACPWAVKKNRQITVFEWHSVCQWYSRNHVHFCLATMPLLWSLWSCVQHKSVSASESVSTMWQ